MSKRMFRRLDRFRRERVGLFAGGAVNACTTMDAVKDYPEGFLGRLSGKVSKAQSVSICSDR